MYSLQCPEKRVLGDNCVIENGFSFQDSHLVSHQSVRLDPPVAPGVALPLCGEGHEVVVVVAVSPSGALRPLARLLLEEHASVTSFGAEYKVVFV